MRLPDTVRFVDYGNRAPGQSGGLVVPAWDLICLLQFDNAEDFSEIPNRSLTSPLDRLFFSIRRQVSYFNCLTLKRNYEDLINKMQKLRQDSIDNRGWTVSNSTTGGNVNSKRFSSVRPLISELGVLPALKGPNAFRRQVNGKQRRISGVDHFAGAEVTNIYDREIMFNIKLELNYVIF